MFEPIHIVLLMFSLMAGIVIWSSVSFIKGPVIACYRDIDDIDYKKVICDNKHIGIYTSITLFVTTVIVLY